MPQKIFLADLYIPEIFQFIEKGQKTGLLSFSTLPVPQAVPKSVHYIWVSQGHVVAAANQLNNEYLVSLIEQQGWKQWMSKRAFDKLVNWCCPLDEPLGKSLKRQGALQNSQLEQLFNLQVSHHVSAVLQLKDGLFHFDQDAPIPTREMTGLSVPATAAILMGLRVLPSWDALADKLPAPDEGLVSIIPSQLYYRLEDLEFQVWKYASRTISIQELAQLLSLPLVKIQQIAFRLSTVGLVTVGKEKYKKLCNNSHSSY